MSDATRVERNPVVASFWQWDPDEDDATVEAMGAALGFVRSDEDRILISVRGKHRNRYEKGDSVWLEFDNDNAVKLIKRVAETLGMKVTG